MIEINLAKPTVVNGMGFVFSERFNDQMIKPKGLKIFAKEYTKDVPKLVEKEEAKVEEPLPEKIEESKVEDPKAEIQNVEENVQEDATAIPEGYKDMILMKFGVHSKKSAEVRDKCETYLDNIINKEETQQ